jgi:hypothetical protein
MNTSTTSGGVDVSIAANENMIEALRIAMIEIEKMKEDKKANENIEEDDVDDDIVMIEGSGDSFKVDESKTKKKDKTYTGTSKVIKLPFVIGSYEYNKHPYAGIIYIGDEGEVE